MPERCFARGLGLALAQEFVQRGWHVLGTVRGNEPTGLHDLADQFPDQVDIESLDINDVAQLTALRKRLSGKSFEILFVVAGVTNKDPNQAIGQISFDEFTYVMATNALAPMRVLEALEGNVPANGMIGVMSSGQGSISDNTTGQRELYRGSKAALNMFMRSFAAREQQKDRALLILAPGWIKTDLGGDNAPYTLEESKPILVDIILDQRDKPGIIYVNRMGKTVPW